MRDEARGREITRELLEAVAGDGTRSQRRIAAELGIALGLVNVYLKRCIKKGWVKVQEAPAHRYAYYLTPHGFAEKSRLTVQYLSSSFSFFRHAKADCSATFASVKERGLGRVVLAGKSDLAEIAILCAVENEIAIVGIVDPAADASTYLGLPLVRSYAGVSDAFDVVMVTDLVNPAKTLKAAAAAVGKDRILVPALLGQGSATERAP